jgi:hypothetical protein
MLKNHFFKCLFILSSSHSFFCFADLYVDSFGKSYQYSRSVPYRAISKVNNHQDFSTITLDDGSTWRAAGHFSKKEVLHWNVNDPVIIYPSSGRVHKEGYCLYNERLNTKAYTDISSLSKDCDVTHLSLISIDTSQNLITLQDGLGSKVNFEVEGSQTQILNNWSVNDSIILGWNSDLKKTEDLYFPYILINVNQVNHIDCEYVDFT